MHKKPHVIAVTGYPYAFPYYFKVFEYLHNKENFVFILPSVWVSKAAFRLSEKPGLKTFGLRAVSFGGRSLLGGIFKGLLPSIAVVLPYLRIKYGTKVLYSCLEPNLLSTLYNGLFAKLFGMKHVLFTWQNIAPEERLYGSKLKFSRFLVKTNLCLSDGIICGNKKSEAIIKKLAPSIRTIVCPISGSDMAEFSPGKDGRELLHRLKISDKKIILFYGALDDRKGIQYLIRAFHSLDRKDAHLVIVGKGSEKDALKALVGDLHRELDVTFVDWMNNDELPQLLNSVDVFVYPSVPRGGWAEQFGYAMVEASACEIPVVATDSGSISEIVINGVTGLLVPPADEKALSGALERILSDSSYAERLGKNGREHVVKNFSHEIIAGKLESFLSSFG